MLLLGLRVGPLLSTHSTTRPNLFKLDVAARLTRRRSDVRRLQFERLADRAGHLGSSVSATFRRVDGLG
jgi:DNA phosphorothioation-dependent restriction protein DptG